MMHGKGEVALQQKETSAVLLKYISKCVHDELTLASVEKVHILKLKLN